MSIRAQALRHSVTVEQQSGNTTDSYGGQVPTWVPFLEGWRVSITALSGREFVAAHAQKAEQLVRIFGRYRPGITEKMRVRHGSDIYVLVAPPNNVGGRNRELELMCSKGRTSD